MGKSFLRKKSLKIDCFPQMICKVAKEVPLAENSFEYLFKCCFPQLINVFIADYWPQTSSSSEKMPQFL